MTRKILKDQTTAASLAKEIKDAIKETTLKTAEFVQLVVNDAELKRAKSVKSPKSLVELWEKRELKFSTLRFHLKKVRQGAPTKVVKVKATPVKAGKKGRKAKPVLLIESDQPMLPLGMPLAA